MKEKWGGVGKFVGEVESCDRVRGGQVESIVSHRKRLVEMFNYCGFIGGDRVS